MTTELLSFLLKKNVIDADQKKLVEIESIKKQISIEDAILNMNFMSQGTLSKFVKEFKNDKFILSEFIIDNKLIKNVPYKFCLSNTCLPIHLNNGCLFIAMTQYNMNIIDGLGRFIEFHKTQVILGNRDEIYDLIQKNYANIDNWIDFIEFSERTAEVFVDRILLDAVDKRASDIHFAPEDSIVKVRYRLDGELKKICIFHKDYFPQVCIRLKILFSVDITTSIQPRDGSLSRFILGERVDFRIAFHNTIYGEHVVIRILSGSNQIGLNEIGYSQNILDNIRKMIHSAGGLIVFIGPTGSGKTTALYSALKEIDHNKYNIMTVEDPVESNLIGVQQTDVNQHPNMTFSSCLRSILRQDPDVILIGEIRDSETASIALRAAMTGHKVFTTLHAKDIFSVFDRFEEFNLPRKLVVNNIKGIVAQRLFKKVCMECSGNGCEKCYFTGYHGRCVVGESVYFDAKVTQIFLSKSRNEQKIQELKDVGYISLEEDILNKIKSGLMKENHLSLVDWI